jgi:DUF1365 family protein
MRSCLYECRVMHHRMHPKVHRFEYGIFLACIDLDELDALHTRLRWLSHNRRNLFEFRDTDHRTRPTPQPAAPKADEPPRASLPASVGSSPHPAPAPLRQRIADWLAQQGVTIPADARIRLLTFPRVLGYVFNPVSFYFVHTASGEPVTAIAEVGNTFGEQKPYVVPTDATASDAGTGRFRRIVPKHFYVSPFSALDLRFDFRLCNPDDRLAIAVDDLDAGDRKLLVTTLTGTRRPLSDRELLRLAVRYPLVTLRTITLIHWQAFRLWRKGIPFHRKAAHPELQQGVHL